MPRVMAYQGKVSGNYCKLLAKKRSIFKVYLDCGGPAIAPFIKNTLDPSKKPVRVKVCKYPAEQQKFIDAYFDKLLEIGFFKVCAQVFFQAVPHLVPKELETEYQTTVDQQPVKNANN